MDIRSYEFNQTTGLPIVGAAVTVYTGTLTHPPVTIITSGVTNGDGLWSFTGLTEVPKDVQVVANGQTKWYKGMTRHGVSAMWLEEPLNFKQAATPGTLLSGVTAGYFKSDGQWYSKTLGTEVRYHNTGTPIATTDIAANAVTTLGTVSVSNIQTSSASAVDVTGATFTLTTAASEKVLVLLTGVFLNSVTANAVATYTYVVNGTPVYARSISADGTINVARAIAGHAIITPGAGTFTYKLQHSTVAGTLASFVEISAIRFGR